MKPTCKLCETKHWTYEEHSISSSLDKTQKLGAAVLERRMAARVTQRSGPWVEEGEHDFAADVPTSVPTDVDCPYTAPAEELTPVCDCGKPREGRYKKCAACRKRAYRERTK